MKKLLPLLLFNKSRKVTRKTEDILLLLSLFNLIEIT
jgi:hypothetical protein